MHAYKHTPTRTLTHTHTNTRPYKTHSHKHIHTYTKTQAHITDTRKREAAKEHVMDTSRKEDREEKEEKKRVRHLEAQGKREMVHDVRGKEIERN